MMHVAAEEGGGVGARRGHVEAGRDREAGMALLRAELSTFKPACDCSPMMRVQRRAAESASDEVVAKLADRNLFPQAVRAQLQLQVCGCMSDSNEPRIRLHLMCCLHL